MPCRTCQSCHRPVLGTPEHRAHVTLLALQAPDPNASSSFLSLAPGVLCSSQATFSVCVDNGNMRCIKDRCRAVTIPLFEDFLFGHCSPLVLTFFPMVDLVTPKCSATSCIMSALGEWEQLSWQRQDPALTIMCDTDGRRAGCAPPKTLPRAPAAAPAGFCRVWPVP